MLTLPTLHTEYDVVIVGCGLSGLVAAYKIKKKAPSLSFRILDSSTRYGGQISCTKTGVDMGARWISRDQIHIVQLCNELHIPLEPRETSCSANGASGRCWAIDQSMFSGIANYELQRFIRYVDVLCEAYYPGRFVGIT